MELLNKQKARIWLADDHPLMREALRQLFDRQEDLGCCGESGDVRSTHIAVSLNQPDLLLLDLRLGTGDGLELIKSLKAQYPDLKILVLSQHSEELYAERALRAGARGYIAKSELSEEVLNAVRAILRGEIYVSRKMTVLVLQQMLCTKTESSGTGVNRLSDRELQVFQLLGAGMTTREVATRLGVSFKTVESHRENLKHKLALRSAAELVHCARTWIQTGEFPTPRPVAVTAGRAPK